MSSDSENLGRPNRRQRQIISDSDSSDDSFAHSLRHAKCKRKRFCQRVISEGESTNDDSDVPSRPVQKKKNHKLASDEEMSSDSSDNAGVEDLLDDGSTSSEWQSDWESMDEETIDMAAASASKNSLKKSSNKDVPKTSYESEISDGESEKCPICLLSFHNQEVASPTSCDHCFCLDCLIEWSKNVNTCPVDRQMFNMINVRAKIGGKIIRHVPIETKLAAEESVQEDSTYCEICRQCNREDRMLLCDGCDLGYHLDCLNPPLEEVPPEEFWHCPECRQNNQNDAESIEIDLEEVPDLMEEARRLGVSYGRSTAALAAQNNLSPVHRSRRVPRTQQAERVRTNVRIRRRAAAAAIAAFDNRVPQPSTSSGFDSISENSRTRSPVPGPSSSSNARRVAARTRSSVLKRKPKRKKRRTATTRSKRRSAEFREVRISEINENGELEEIVTYIRTSASATGYGGPVPAGRRRKKRKKQRRARTVASVAASLKTAKRRLATRLKIMNSTAKNSNSNSVQLVPKIKNESVPLTSSAALRVARHHAGIAQLSLFGSGLGLDYSPPGSEDEQEESSTNGGTGLLSRVRSAATSGIRRRLGLKATIAQPNITHSTDSSIDILSSILSSQEIWHSSKSKITLKSDGSFDIEKPKKKPEANNNIDNSPVKIKPNNESPSKKEKPLDLTNVNPNNLVQQAPMYNNSRGGGNRSGGNYRGGNYRDNNSRHSHGGNYNNTGGGGGSHDSYSGGGGGSGRHSFGGTGNHPQDYFPGGGNYSNYEHRNAPPPLLGMQSPFRSRNPQNFRNRFPPPQFNQEDRPPPGRDLDQDLGRDQSRNQGRDFPFQDQFARPRMPGMPGVPPPPPPLALRMSAPRSNENKGPQDRETNAEDRSNRENERYDSQQGNQQESKDNKPDEEYDMYDDLEAPRKSDNRTGNEDEDSSHSLLPPPEPPTDLFDFDESERGQDSDREDLVIDDTPREDAAVKSSNVQPSADKYDPFAADSDSDDSQHHHHSRFAAKNSSKQSHSNIQPTPLRPPPGLSEFPGLKNDDNESIMGDGASIMGDNASIMGDNASVMGDNASIMGDDDYQSSKPNRDEKRGSSSRALEPPPNFGFSEMDSDMMSDDGKSKDEEKKNSSKAKVSVPRIRLTAYDDDEDEDSESDCPNFSIYSSETINVARHTEQELSSQIEPLNQSAAPVEEDKKKPDTLEPPSMPSFEKDEEEANKSMEPLEPPPMPLGMLDDDMRSKAGSPESVAPLEPPPVPPMDDLESVADPLEPPPMPPMGDLESNVGSPVAPLEPPPMPPMDDLEGSMVDPLEPPPMPPMEGLDEDHPPLEPPPIPMMDSLDEHPPLEPPPMPPLDSLDRPETPGPLEPPPMPPLGAMDTSMPPPSMTSMPPPRLTSMPPPSMTSMPPPSMTMQPPHMINLQMPPPTMLPVQVSAPMTSMQPPLPLTIQAPPPPLEPPPLPPLDDLNLDESQNNRPLEPPPAPPSILGDDDDNSLPTTSEEEDEGEEDNEEDDTPVIGPKNRGRKKSISKKNDESIGDQDEDVIVGDVQACDLTESETSHYVDAVQKERQTLNKSSGKIQLDSRGKITFKIGNLSRLNKVNLYDELDETEISRMNLDLEKEREKEKELDKDKDRDRDRDKEKDREKDKERDKDRDREREKDKHKEREREKEKEKDSKRKDDKDKSKYDSKSKYSEKDSKSKSKYDDKKSSKPSKSKYEESSKSSKDSKSKHYSSKDSKHKKSHDKPLHPQSGWDIKPRGMTSSDSSSDSQSSDSSPTRKDSSPIRLDSPILLDSPVRSPIRKSDVSKSATKQINIDLDELQQTLDKKLVELEDLNKLHPDDTDIVSIPDDIEFDQSKNKKSDEAEDQLVKPIEPVDDENEKILPEKDVPVATASVIKLTEQENNLLDEIEKSCEVELNKEVTPSDESEEIKKDVVVEEVSADKETENTEEDDVEKIVDELIEKPITNDNISVKSMELSDAEDKAIEDIEKEAEAEESGSEKKDEEEDVVITADINDKSEIIDLDSAEFVDKPVTFVGDLDNDGYQIESTPALSRVEPEKETPPKRISEEPASEWEAEGAFTPCKDERIASKNLEMRVGLSGRSVSLIETDLEPITPTKDRISDGLDGIRTPAGYAGLGTEAISETDEAMNFEDELALLNMRCKDRDVEEGEIPDDRPRKQSAKTKDLDDEAKQRRSKRGKKEKANKDTNKENIASDNNLAAAWKKSSKIVATKERQYREKRSKSKDPKLKKKKEVVKKKDKRKELPRYNVRKLVQEKPRARKDAYGRDIRESSRSRSLSLSRERSLSFIRRSRSYSPRGRRVSRSRSRSWSRTRRSRSYRSVSRRRSLSPRSRREKLRRRSLSRTRARTRSRSRSHSRRRSVTPRRRSRRSMSKKRRSRSRSRTRSRSHSHSRRKDKKKHVSRSRSRVRKRSRSKSQKKREKKHSKRKVSRSRSRSIDRHNWEHHQLALAEKVADANFQREASWAARWAPSWSRSRSRTPPIIHPENIARNWSPPTLSLLNSVNVPPKNLKVILTNKEAIKKKKKEKRKENRKLKEAEKKRKNKKGRSPPPSKEVFASGDNILVSVCFNKDNDVQPTGVPELPETIPLLPPVKRRRREPLQLEPPQLQAPPAKKAKKDKAKEKAVAPRAKSPQKPVKKKEKKKSKAAEIAASKKPMAVIDLDQSPFREQTPSPRDVIVLSDDDDKQQTANEELEEMGTPEQPQESHTPARLDAQFLQGPKTPPEPQVKFSIANKQSNLRPSLVNPLLEEEELEEEMEMEMDDMAEMEELLDEQVEEDHELRAQEELESRTKVGPNTPPEPPTSPPTSPDAYDPFDPTKSRSPTPEPNSQEDNNADERLQTADGDSPSEPQESQADDKEDQQEQTDAPKPAPEKPKIISVVTIKRVSPVSNTPPLTDQNEAKADVSPATNQAAATATQQQQQQQQQQQPQQTQAAPQISTFPAINPVLATVAAAVQRSTIFSAASQLVGPRNLLQTNTLVQNSQMKQQQRPTLPNIFANSMPKPMPVRTLPAKLQAKNMSMLAHNGSDANIEMSNDNIDMSSPYSPGSSLSDGLFDPPSPAFNSSPNVALSTKIRKSQEKKDAFDALFDGSPIVHKSSMKVRMKKSEKDKKRKGTHSKIGVRMDENQLQILDDLPSSAVEMQVKDKFLKKLNRQERVVEEVKLVLKPHYTKKHVTKEEYKDIMRKAVPKICHNKSGEINPKKIAALIEAYVKRVRAKKKFPVSTGATNSVNKKPAKTLWS